VVHSCAVAIMRMSHGRVLSAALLLVLCRLLLHTPQPLFDTHTWRSSSMHAVLANTYVSVLLFGLCFRLDTSASCTPLK
jgi:hypothetical protein